MSAVASRANGAASTARFTFVVDWPAPSKESGEAIRAFWAREGAFNDEAQMKARLPQVVMHALTPDGEVAGVCTAVVMTPPHLAQPVYYWRTFVGKAWRATPLVMMLLKRSCVLLEAHARDNNYPCIGILLELENNRFKEKGRTAVWWNPRFVYIGRSQRGLDLRVFYFKGARLKGGK
jgi:hypothetical protein